MSRHNIYLVKEGREILFDETVSSSLNEVMEGYEMALNERTPFLYGAYGVMRSDAVDGVVHRERPV